MIYVLRKYVNDTHSWVWGDFIDNMKSNFKQCMAIYAINIFIAIAFVVGYTFYVHVMTGVTALVLKGFITAMALIFILMQMYVYQLMVGFELPVKKIYKYAAILNIMKLPWNVFSGMALMALVWLVYELSMSYEGQNRLRMMSTKTCILFSVVPLRRGRGSTKSCRKIFDSVC